MLALPEVTLCCIDTARHRLAIRALGESRRDIRFGRTLFFTQTLELDTAPAGIEIVPTPPIESREAYSQFVLKSLAPYIGTSHALLVQWDGYVWNPDAWDHAFLDFDYIGAKWFWHNDHMRVGNGGFSLRSRRLLQALQDPRITLSGPEDETIGRTFRPLLEQDHRIRFADEALADRFAFEASYPIGRPFGFHGLFNFCRTVASSELAALASSFDDAIARSPQFAQLLRNCMAMAQWSAAAAIAERILAADSQNDEVRRILTQAMENAVHQPVASRNDRCPCGSGKRYKHCHGAVAVSTLGSAIHAAVAAPAPSSPMSVNATPDSLVAQGVEAHQRGDLALAEDRYKAALGSAPDHPYALHYLGVLRYQRNEPVDALPLIEQALTRVPYEPEFHNNLGLVLARLDRLDDAIAAYRRTLGLKTHHAVAWNNLGLALQARNDVEGAIDAFRHALSITPEFGEAHWNLALALLARGEFTQGWREYEWRLSIPELGQKGRIYPGPRWDGSDLNGKTILLTREQGLGDTLQFVRFARQLAARGARVLVEAQEPLVQLLASAPGVAGVCRAGDSLPAYDFHLPLLSIAQALGINASNIPGEVPYLSPDPSHVAALAPLLAPYRGTRKVGIAWAGRADHPNDRHRSCPLAAFVPLLAMPGITWFSLQKGDGEDEIAALSSADGIVSLDARNDFDRKAALVSALDLVISVDTGNAHLAGALGRPLWLLLPFAAEWRWMTARADCPWYPTARLFRQPRIGDWASVMTEVQRALATT